MRSIIFKLCAVVALSMQLVYANDELQLVSGDRLLGEITQINSEYVIINTAFAEQVKVKHELIAGLMTDSDIQLVFSSGEVKQVKLSKLVDQPFRYQNGDQYMPLNLAQLADNPNAILEAKNNQADNIKYSGHLDVGLSKTSGNDNDQDYHASFMGQARTLKNRYTFELTKTIEKNEGDKTQDESFLSLQYDRFLNNKWYAFTSASFEEDFEELLKLRSTYSLGSGYQFFDQDDLHLRAEVGLAYVDEDFEDDEDNHYAGSRWAINYDHALLKWLGIYHDQEGSFSLENNEDITIRSSSGFKFPLNEYINAKLEANIDWDRSPADGATGTDKEYIFTLGYEF